MILNDIDTLIEETVGEFLQKHKGKIAALGGAGLAYATYKGLTADHSRALEKLNDISNAHKQPSSNLFVDLLDKDIEDLKNDKVEHSRKLGSVAATLGGAYAGNKLSKIQNRNNDKNQ